MTIKRYVNWSDRKILAPQELEILKNSTILERLESEDDDGFYHWLDWYAGYNAADIFRMDDKEKQSVKQDFIEEASKAFLENWEKIEIEIDIGKPY